MYFVTFHPAATIYNQKLVNVFKNDIKKLVNKLQKINMPIEMKVLPRKFYLNDTKQVAKDLLGKTLVRKNWKSGTIWSHNRN